MSVPLELRLDRPRAPARITFATACSIVLALLLGACAQVHDDANAPNIGGTEGKMVLAPGWVTGSAWPAETVVALNSVVMRSSSLVSGDVGVITASTGAVLNGSSELSMLANAEVTGRVRADSIDMQSSAHVSGTAAYNELTGFGTIDGAKSATLVTPVAITVVAASNFSAGTSNLTVAAGALLNKSAGNYNIVTLVSGTAGAPTILRLGRGTYNFGDLVLGDYARLECKKACELHVKNRVSVGAHSYIGTGNETGNQLTMDMTKLFVEGTNGTVVPSGTPAACAIGTRSQLDAFTFVPNGTLVLNSGVSGVGKFIAKDVDVGSDVELMTGTSDQRVLLEDFVVGPTWPTDTIVALNSLDILSGANITGNATVIENGTGGFLNTSEIVIGTTATVTGNVRGDKIELKSGGKILGTATYNTISNAGTISSQVTPLAVPVDVRVPVFPVVTSGSTSKTYGSRTDSTLAAGRYRDLTMTAGVAGDPTTLILTGGVYEFRDFEPGNYSTITCSAACEVRVKRTMTTGSNVTIEPGAGVDISKVQFFAFGDTQSSPGTTPYAISLGSTNVIKAFMFAGRGTLNVGTGAQLSGHFVARDVRLGSGATEVVAGTVVVPPAIQTQPVGDVIVGGQSYTFSIAATGTDITFQWRKGTTNIAGATSGAYTISNATAADSASYTVVVSNSAGTVTSSAALLTVGVCDPDTYVPVVTNCGTGVCARTGMQTCVNGAFVNSCVQGAQTGNDNNCDGLDNNCNGQTDEGYVPQVTSCGAGACSATGMTSCVAGVVKNSCTQSMPAMNDATCDGRDDDCDGRTDENYVNVATSCGIGACRRTGTAACIGGAIVDSCEEGDPAASDADCDNVDDDCDGEADQDYVSAVTHCGVGACAATGMTDCVAGVVTNSCVAGTHAPNDATCNGVDDDCDGRMDENYPTTPTTCGVGACASTGTQSCVSGTVKNTCRQGTPTSDNNCNGVDNDCNGAIDDGFVATVTNCGTGVCARTGTTSCSGGVQGNSCVAGSPTSSTDTTCDGLDNNCNGSTDEGYVSVPTSCGQGVCARTGATSCVSGSVRNSCVQGSPNGNDVDCNNQDNNCNGQIDEGYVSVATACGTGACARTGATSCVTGTVVDSCMPGMPSSDANCNGIDDNCNGAVDEQYATQVTSCGTGVCARTGVTSCAGGFVNDSCAQGSPTSTSDTTCDGLDDNCNGTSDEGYVPIATNCGVGGCARTGTRTCVNGATQNSCVAGTPAANDVSCDGVDNNCNGLTDEGYTPTPTSCGSGSCSATGQNMCLGGAVTNTCTVPTNDRDHDGTPDCADGCPDDALKIAAGGCGCGVADVDSDGDHTLDCNDSCPLDAANDADGDGVCGNVDACPIDPANDVDGDGLCANADNCPTVANANQQDTDGDHVGDVCDPPIMLSIAAGGAHSCSVLQNSTVRCWGDNSSGQLGDGSTTSSNLPVLVSGLNDAQDVQSGNLHSCALRATGQVVCWGANDNGQLGNGTSVQSNVPAAVSGLNDAVQIAVGRQHSCAIRVSGQVVCWGANDSGQLGNGTLVASSVPVASTGVTDAVQLAVGYGHTCAIRAGGTVACWGANWNGQLGNATLVDSKTAVAVSGLTGATQLAVGDLHSCAIESNGTVACWGANWYGQLGNGGSADSSIPVTVTGIADATQIELGELHSCVLRATHGVACWGYNAYGELGNGSLASSPTAVAVSGLSDASEISAGDLHTCALRSNGESVCWGNAESGQLGQGTGISVLTPVAVAGAAGITKVAPGFYHTCALHGSGAVDCFGINADGQLGNGSGQDSTSPAAVSGITTAMQLAVGSDHSCVVLASGQVRCWGYGDYGQLGDGGDVTRTTPVAVSGISNAVQVGAGDLHSCALLATGAVRCWGSGISGELGQGTAADSGTPVNVSGISDAIGLSVGGSHACVVHSTGQVSCWGYGAYGQLGNGLGATSTSPVVVTGVSNAIQVDCGRLHTCALLSTGAIQCWGQNSDGQLGNGTAITAKSPVSVSGIANASAVVSGATHSCALLATGGVRCWGSGAQAQLGNGGLVRQTSSVAVSGISDAVALGAGYYDTCAVRSGGELRCWGDASQGKLGNRYPWSSAPVRVQWPYVP